MAKSRRPLERRKKSAEMIRKSARSTGQDPAFHADMFKSFAKGSRGSHGRKIAAIALRQARG